MSKRKLIRLGGVATTLFAAVALISTLVAATGAYFTATQPGTINGNFGTVVVATSGPTINFANLMPGEMQTKTVTVAIIGTGNEDIYVAFKNDNGAWSSVNELGMYGKFVIAGKTFDNLNNNSAYTAANPGVAGTDTDTDGPCGLPQQPINYLPHVVNIFTLTPGQTATFDVSFGLVAHACPTRPHRARLPSRSVSQSRRFSPALIRRVPSTALARSSRWF